MKRHVWTPAWIATAMLSAAIATAALGGGYRRDAASEGAATAVGAAARTTLGPFRLGQQVRNRAHLKLRLELGGGGRPQTLDILGDWAATPTDIHDGVVEVQCALGNVEATIAANLDASTAGANQAQERAARELATALAAPFFISYRADGAIANLWFSRGVNPTIANVMMTLAGTQQLVRGRPAEPAWVVVERDVNGQYTAAYRESGPGRFDKKKARYVTASPIANAVTGQLASAAGPRLQPSIRIERSDLELRVDPQGRLLEVRGEDRVVFELGSPGLEMTTTVEVELGDGRTVEHGPIAPGDLRLGEIGRAHV